MPVESSKNSTYVVVAIGIVLVILVMATAYYMIDWKKIKCNRYFDECEWKCTEMYKPEVFELDSPPNEVFYDFFGYSYGDCNTTCNGCGDYTIVCQKCKYSELVKSE